MKSKSNGDVFVALLRGVNVGGNNMISMKSLKESFEKLGFAQVTTYINSGNIVFKTTEADPRKLEKKIEQMLERDYQLTSKVVVRSLAEMESLLGNLPTNWGANKDWRYNVVFLRHTIDSEKILDELEVRKDIEEVFYRPGTLLWSSLMNALKGTEGLKFSSRKMGQEITVRNTNTTRKLRDLMKKAAETAEDPVPTKKSKN
ncbi:MAG TPA: DUF1697 domain-containing protein [Pyrinomonadaceae bacterium]|jgi:uncharacterized protein (DUF1697 family)|nr:DUF1697 domain-containing protein [Pyrinomonadaceae bacterium]